MVVALTKTVTTNKMDPELPNYATGGAFVTFTQGIADDIRNNIIFTGAPQSSPKVTATELTHSPNAVTILDCFAGPSFKPVFIADDKAGHKKGQSAVAPGHSDAPHPLTVQVTNRTGTWKVEQYKIDSSKTC